MFVSMRLGPLVKLIAGVALVAVLVFGVLVATSANSTPKDNTTPTPAPPANSASAAAAVRPLVFHVARTQGTGLNMRGCPGADCARVGWIADGGTFTATCSIIGQQVNGDRTWLSGTAASQSGYVSGYFLDPTTVTMPACAAKG